jgi:hypothetical protein
MTDKYFNKDYFKEYKDSYRISQLFDISEDTVNKIINAGFEYNFATTAFNSNILIGDVRYNLKISWNDGYLMLFIKRDNETYNNNNLKFYARRVSLPNGGYSHNLDVLLFRFELWIKNTTLSNASQILKRKLTKNGQSVTLEVDYVKGDDVITKISQQNVYIKKADGSPKTLDYTFLNFEDIINIDKIVIAKLEEIEKTKNLGFKDFVNNEKNTIQ